jgi:hypothetical protein
MYSPTPFFTLRPGFPQAHSRNIRSNGQYGLLLLFRTVGTCKSVTQELKGYLSPLAKLSSS